ncbi:hypothetical protein [Arthrospiribacter ruber]|uniref:Uncharacterized protein n=1 Tax=Arthrospiribacter ruber TaxID=2487934 RepID=A0A951MGM4_9BACT|nr:hypothetical protein [Arthrospiribacter ruber]MBW3470382.1 hypothetical protein [Arthrospiribacter ruber]
MVRLKVLACITRPFPLSNFNSCMVRLKATGRISSDQPGALFQFLYGAIESVVLLCRCFSYPTTWPLAKNLH